MIKFLKWLFLKDPRVKTNYIIRVPSMLTEELKLKVYGEIYWYHTK